MARSVHSTRYKALRERLVAERVQRGLTQTEVAQRLGRPQSFVSKIESGERRVDVIELMDLLAALEADWVRFLRHL